jgi:hypothetical protein
MPANSLSIHGCSSMGLLLRFYSSNAAAVAPSSAAVGQFLEEMKGGLAKMEEHLGADSPLVAAALRCGCFEHVMTGAAHVCALVASLALVHAVNYRIAGEPARGTLLDVCCFSPRSSSFPSCASVQGAHAHHHVCSGRGSAGAGRGIIPAGEGLVVDAHKCAQLGRL